MIDDEELAGFRAQFRAKLAEAGPWSAERRAEFVQFVAALRRRRARDASTTGRNSNDDDR